MPGISKSRFTDYRKCAKLGYMPCYRDRYAASEDPPSRMNEGLLEAGLAL